MATVADVTMATNNVTLSRHFDELMASQCAQTSDILGSQCNQTSDLGGRINHTERFLNQTLGNTKDSIKDAGDRAAIHTNDNITRAKDSIKDSGDRAAIHINDNVNQSRDSVKDAGERNVIQLRDSIERNSDNTRDHIALNNAAIERIGASGARTTEVTSAAVGTAVERNGYNIAERANAIAMENRIVSDNKYEDIKHSIYDAKYKNSIQLNDIQKDLHYNKYSNLKLHQQAQCKDSEYRYHAARDLEHHFKQVSRDAADLKYTLSEKSALTNYEMLKMQGLLQLQASENSSKASLESCKLENALSKQASDNFNILQYQGLENKCKLEAKIDHCCCELKERIIGSEKSVTDVFLQTENSRLRDSLRSLETQNLIFQSTK